MPNPEQKNDTAESRLVDLVPGSCDDDPTVRGIVSEVIKRSNFSRDQIADEMSRLIGKKITGSQLNTYTADSKEGHRWPLCWTRAFCFATGDFTLIKIMAERSGFVAITPEEQSLLELGRQYLARQQAAENVARLEAELRRRA